MKMLKTICLAVAAVQLALLGASAQTPSADAVMTQAKIQAAAGHKAIFVHFGASWCPWCRKLDAFLIRPDVKPVFEKYFVPVKLDVQEHPEKKSLENPGADALFKNVGGPDGLPFSAFLDPQGSLIVNSRDHGQNIGFPGEAGEIQWFLQMMKKAAPAMSSEDLATIESALRGPRKA